MADKKKLPLSGVRVLDAATFIAAPYAAARALSSQDLGILSQL
jgi:crotonobetainyl-CoA:carnitine CoA-transferase CaiB-like acyl-CoA transferase